MKSANVRQRTSGQPAPTKGTYGRPRKSVPHWQRSTAPAVADKPESSSPATVYPTIDWVKRRKERTVDELHQLSKKRIQCTKAAIEGGMEALELLIPGFVLNLEAMGAMDWVKLLTDPQAVAQKIVILKTYHPKLDLGKALNKYPRILLLAPGELERASSQVRSLLATAPDPDAILVEVPALLEPPNLISALVTIQKWYHLAKDPVMVLQQDPDIIRRAQENDVPFEPVYVDENGNWMAPLLNYKEKRTDWQEYIDRTVYKQK